MTYFSKFPFVADYEIQGQKILALDITRRTGIESNILASSITYQEYSIREGESPHMIADRVYGSPDWYFVILMFNEIHDVDQDWPLSQHSLEQFVKRKYPGPERDEIHHYVSLRTGAVVTSNHLGYDLIPVTNYEYEVGQNDAKRKIKVPYPNVAGQIVALHKNQLSRI